MWSINFETIITIWSAVDVIRKLIPPIMYTNFRFPVAADAY